MLCSLQNHCRVQEPLAAPETGGIIGEFIFFQFIWGISAQSDIINVIECRDEYRTNTGEQPGKSLQKGVLPC